MDNLDLSHFLTDEEFERLTSCQTSQEWNEACDAVKAARGGEYPQEWWQRMMMSGLMRQIFARFGASTDITVRVV